MNLTLDNVLKIIILCIPVLYCVIYFTSRFNRRRARSYIIAFAPPQDTECQTPLRTYSLGKTDARELSLCHAIDPITYHLCSGLSGHNHEHVCSDGIVWPNLRRTPDETV